MTDRRKLTDAFAKKHFEAGNPRVIWDRIRSGFGLKVNAKGHVIWIVKFRIGTGRSARTHQHKIGNPHMYSCVEEVVLLFRPACSPVKMDQGFIYAANLIGSVLLA